MKTLAEQVGEEVMGYTMKWVDGSDWNQEMPLNQQDDWGYATLVAEDDGLRFEWAPDENVNDWWELVGKMKELYQGRYLGFERYGDGVSFAFLRHADRWVTEGSGDSIFEATCCLALKLVRNE